FFQAEDGIRAFHVTGVQTCALPISSEIIATENNSPGSQSDGRRLTRADFNFLRKGQPVSYVIEKLGQNFRDVGSGFHILVYEYRSEERRVGKECRIRCGATRIKKQT